MSTNYIDKQRYFSIDLLKGICILLVVFSHCTWTATEESLLLFPFWVDMAVPIFMIISGFVSAKSFQRKGVSTLKSAYSAKLLSTKLTRYLIPYLLFFLMEELVIMGVYDNKINIHSVFKAFITGGQGPGSYYTPVLVQFIFVFPLIYFIVNKMKFNGVLLCGLINLFFECAKTIGGMTVQCYRLMFFRYILLVAYGCYLASEKYVKNTKLAHLSMIAGILYIIKFRYSGATPVITNLWPETSLFACLFIIPLSGSLILNNWRCKPLEWLGKASYHIYLMQTLYYFAFSEAIALLIDSRAIAFSVNILICVLFGVMFYIFETRLSNLLRKAVSLEI